MFLRLTDRFTGRLPIDVGGKMVNTLGAFQVSDADGARLIAANAFGQYLAECDADGKYLTYEPLPVPEPEQAAPAQEEVRAEERAEPDPIEEEQEVPPSTIEVPEQSKKKGKR